MSTYEQKMIAHYSGVRGRIMAVGYARQRQVQREWLKLNPPNPQFVHHVETYRAYRNGDVDVLGRMVADGTANIRDYLRYRISQEGYNWGEIIVDRFGPRDMQETRHVIFYEAYHRYPKTPWRVLCRVFGGRDHSSILHSLKVAEEIMEKKRNG